MDFSQADPNTLAPQLRKPEGEYGKEVGKTMAEKNNEVIAFTIECLDLQPRDHVLEIGFGPGEGIAQAVQLTPNGYVAGIDFSPEMLEMAQDRNHRSLMQEHVELTLGTADALPYDDESFDKVFAVNVFHFWPDPARELAECKRVLKSSPKGGPSGAGRCAFFMSYPAAYRPGFRETGIFIAREPAEVEGLLRDAGFTTVHSKSFTLGDFHGFATIGAAA